MNIALLTAGGTGSRMHQDIPKQFISVYDKPIIVYTLEAFQRHPNIDAIIVAVLEHWEDILWAFAKQFNITKLKWIVKGGATGQESIHNCLKKLEEKCSPNDVVMIHDGNRALVSNEIISDSLATFERFGNAVAAIPCVEAVFRSPNGQQSIQSIDRKLLFRTQTPHTYSLEKLLWAHSEAQKRNITNTAATCTLMSQLGETVYFSKGSEKNIKITTVEDIEIFKALLKSTKDDWIK